MSDLHERFEQLAGPAAEVDLGVIATRVARRRRRRHVARAASLVVLVLLVVGGATLWSTGGPDESVVIDEPERTEPSPTTAVTPTTGVTPTSTVSEEPAAPWDGSVVPEFVVADTAVLATTVVDDVRSVATVDLENGAVGAALLELPVDWWIGGVALDRDEGVGYVYVERPEFGGGSVLALRSGEAPRVIFNNPDLSTGPYGNGLALSPDGAVLAMVDNFDTGRIRRLRIGDVSADEIGWDRLQMGDLPLRSIVWPRVPGTAYYVEVGEHEGASWVEQFAVGGPGWIEVLPAGDLRPPADAPPGTGWSPGLVRDGTVTLVESCCALDANSYDGGTSLVDVDTRSGQVVARRPAPAGLSSLLDGPTADEPVGVGWGELWRMVDGEWRRVEAPVFGPVSTGW
jgi:hypothetical protein